MSFRQLFLSNHQLDILATFRWSSKAELQLVQDKWRTPFIHNFLTKLLFSFDDYGGRGFEVPHLQHGRGAWLPRGPVPVLRV